MGRELQTFLDYPPLKPGASFNLDTLKAEMAEKMAQAEAASKGTGQQPELPSRRAARKGARVFNSKSNGKS